jgi:alcohol dehydrogenase
MSQYIILERGCIDKIAKIISQFGINHPLLVTGRRSYEVSGAKARIEKILEPKKIERFEVTTALPEIKEVERGIKFLKHGNFDAIIAIGGGNVLDTAKLIRFFSSKGKSVLHAAKLNQTMDKPKVPLLALPTTAGSGAEVTHFAVLYLGHKKYSIANQGILPEFALIDPDLSTSNSPHQTAISGMDALAQGIESYWSSNSTGQSRKYAEQAIVLALEALIPAVCENDINAVEKLSRSALLAGMAINISTTTAPHAVSYILTAKYRIPHGHAVALTLGEFIKHVGRTTERDVNHRLGEKFVLKILENICIFLGASNPTTASNNLKRIMKTIGLDTRLSKFGIRSPDIPHIADNVNLKRLANHPRKVTKEALQAILQDII